MTTEAAAAEFYLLSTNRQIGDVLLWWGPDRSGYTTVLDRAGRYSEAQARSIAKGHAADVVAIPCHEADARAIRTVSSCHVSAFRALARVCSRYRCDDDAAEGQTVCAACTLGDAGPLHYRADQGGVTWCGKRVGDGARTYVERQPVGDYEPRRRDKTEVPVCEECARKAQAHRLERERLHYHDCGNPYCQGCKSCDRCRRTRNDGCTCEADEVLRLLANVDDEDDEEDVTNAG